MSLEKRSLEPQIDRGYLGNRGDPTASPNECLGGKNAYRHLEVQITHPMFTTVPREFALRNAIRESGLGVCRQRRQLLTAC